MAPKFLNRFSGLDMFPQVLELSLSLPHSLCGKVFFLLLKLFMQYDFHSNLVHKYWWVANGGVDYKFAQDFYTK